MARPAKFAREEIIDRAMQAFWERGYCATSMAQLVESTQLKPGSLYAAFKSKNGLFLAALDHYGALSCDRIGQALAQSATPLQGIRNYFQRLAEQLEQPTTPHSCFLVNTALELARQDEEVREHVNRHFQAIEALFREALEAAQAAGELPPERNPAQLASFLMSNIWGLRVLAGSAPVPGKAQAIVNQLLASF